MKRSFGDFLFVAAPKVLGGLLQVAFNFILLRHFGQADFGTLAVCVSAVLLLDAVLGSAVDIAVVKLASAVDEEDPSRSLSYQRAGLQVKLLLGLLMGAAVAMFSGKLAGWLFQSQDRQPLLILSALALVGLMTLRSLQTRFQIRRRFLLYGATDLIQNGLRYGGIALLLILGVETPGRVLGIHAAALTAVAAGCLAVGGRELIAIHLPGKALRELIHLVRWYWGTTAIGSIVSRMDVFLVSTLAGAAAAGVFSAAQIVALVPQLLGMYLSVIFTPRIMPLWKQGMLKGQYLQAQKALLVVCLGLYALAWSSVGLWGSTLLPERFADAVPVVLLLLPAGLCSLANFPWTIPFLLFAKPRSLLLLDLLAFPLLLGAYWYTVPRYGPMGAAAVTTGYALVKTIFMQRWALQVLNEEILTLREEDMHSHAPDNLASSGTLDLASGAASSLAVAAERPERGFLRLAVAALALLGTCSSAVADKPPPRSVGAPGSQAAAPYRLAPGDVIQVRFFFNPELNDQVQLRPDGAASLQLIGDVRLAGKTVQEAAALLEKLYSKELRSPRITVQVRGYASQKVYVTGQVVKPGLINMPGPMTVLDAISEAGGMRLTGSKKRIVLIRKGPDGKPVIRELALMRKGIMTDEAFELLQPFDVLMVPETGIAKADRWVEQHIRQLVPVTLSAGFTYLWTRGGEFFPVF